MRYITLSLLLLATSGTVFAGGNPIAGKDKIILCMGCHGADGSGSSSLFPKLAEQGEAYLAKQIRDFKSGARKEEHMTSMAETIDPADIDNIAAYFSGQPHKKGNSSTAETTTGRQIYSTGITGKGVTACISCHGKQALGVPVLKYPSLAGQYQEYLVKTLKDFRSGMRNNDPGKVMQSIATKLSDQEIDAVANYIGGLR